MDFTNVMLVANLSVGAVPDSLSGEAGGSTRTGGYISRCPGHPGRFVTHGAPHE